MLLRRLVEHSHQMGLPPRLYSEGPVRYIIELDSRGNPLSADPVDTSDPASPRTKKGMRRSLPQVQRSSNVKPLLLADNGEYTLGLPRDEAKTTRAQAYHRAYVDLVASCARATGEPTVQAVAAFLADDPASRLRLPEKFDRRGMITFRVDGTFPIDLPAVQSFWAMQNDPDADPDHPAPVMQCVVCGKKRPVLNRLQGKIKGVPGGKTSGTSIISANAHAFESYGLTASLVAPTCAECGERFTKAANELLSNRSSRLLLGDAAFVFWTKERVEFSFLDYLADPQPEQVRDLLNSVRSGHAMAELDDTAFYATALSGSGARTVVRDWLDTTVGEARRHLALWFQRQSIVGGYGEDPKPLGLRTLALSTVREDADLAPPTPRALLRAALTGTPVPSGLLFQAVRRNRAEQGITRPRAALIKLVLTSQRTDFKEDSMVQLDMNSPSPAYRCGRLLAVLEEIQRSALPGAKTTIVDRFFGTASTAPSSVFSRLLRGAQPHLSKLERDRPSAWRALQYRLEEIVSGISGFPRVLTLDEQGLFALGYYHQRAHDRKAAQEAAVRRKAGLLAPDPLGAKAEPSMDPAAVGETELEDN